MDSIEVEINDFELISNPDFKIENGDIRTLFNRITEKDNQTSEFERKYIIWKRFVNETCKECIDSLLRCYLFSQNETKYFVNEFKEKYSEQLNGPDERNGNGNGNGIGIEVRLDDNIYNDMQRD
jgi:hypothetical protein